MLFFCLIPQGKNTGKGNTDGTHTYKKFFNCPKNCGIFVPFSQIITSSPPTANPSAHLDTEELSVGDRVTYFTTDKCRHGMVMDVKEKDGQIMVRISTVSSFPNGIKREKRIIKPLLVWVG